MSSVSERIDWVACGPMPRWLAMNLALASGETIGKLRLDGQFSQQPPGTVSTPSVLQGTCAVNHTQVVDGQSEARTVEPKRNRMHRRPWFRTLSPKRRAPAEGLQIVAHAPLAPADRYRRPLSASNRNRFRRLKAVGDQVIFGERIFSFAVESARGGAPVKCPAGRCPGKCLDERVVSPLAPPRAADDGAGLVRQPFCVTTQSEGEQRPWVTNFRRMGAPFLEGRRRPNPGRASVTRLWRATPRMAK